MKQPSPLPQKIQYLEPVRKQLAALGPDHVWEDTDLSILRRVVRKWGKNLSSEELGKALAEEVDILEQWITESKGAYDYMAFLLPLLGEPEIVMGKEPEPLAKSKLVRMDLPKGAKSKTHADGVMISIGGMRLDLIPRDKAGFEYKVNFLRSISADSESGKE